MKILLINKFLHPKGGSETYVLGLGACLESRGHRVEYFGMDHPERQLGNRVGAYGPYADYHGGGGRVLSCIYSREAAKQLRRVLEDFQPDVCHVNNFHHQLTPSILVEIRRWQRREGKRCPIIHTAHDSQLVCPNHLMRNGRGENCRKCLGGHYRHCLENRCIHGSVLKSAVGALEAWLWDRTGIWRHLDRIIAPSRFLAEQLATNPQLRQKITVIPNFVDIPGKKAAETGDYVLYFGRYSAEKGIGTLLKAADALPQIPFVFAGDGTLNAEVEKRQNVKNLGFLTGEALVSTIAGAAFAVVPSECYENCPFSVIESQMYGTPVIGSRMGGIPELIREGETGLLFEAGNADELEEKLRYLLETPGESDRMTENCKTAQFETLDTYCEKLLRLYED